MPTYQYACTACDHRFEAVQKFTDDSLTICPECSGALRKVYGSVGVVFKGSGFYRTDARDGGKSIGSDQSGGSDKAGDKAGDKVSAGSEKSGSGTSGSGSSDSSKSANKSDSSSSGKSDSSSSSSSASGPSSSSASKPAAKAAAS